MTKKTSEKKNKKFDFIALILFVLVFAVSTYAMTFIRSNNVEGSIDPGKIEIFQTNELDERLSADMTPIVVDEDSPFYKAFSKQDRVNVMLLGVADGNTDTIMVGSYDMESQSISIITVPRDTYYYRAGYKNYAEYKINAIYRSNGKSVVPVASAVSEILCGMPIHYYAIVTYDDIREIMDVIGGVEMEIPFHMKYDDTTPGAELHIDIPKGNQMITSANVEQFLRFRKGVYGSYITGDIGRSEVQREFVQKVMAKVLEKGNLTDVAKAVLSNVESDLKLSTAVKVAKKAMEGLSGDSISLYSLPGGEQIINGLSFWVQDDAGIYSMMETIYGLNKQEESTSGSAVTQ